MLCDRGVEGAGPGRYTGRRGDPDNWRGIILGANVLLLGGGDAGLKIADGLLRLGGVERLAIADRSAARAAADIDLLNSCHAALVRFAEIDALDTSALEALLRRERPDLIVQAASLISPWSIIGRDHPTAGTLAAAGIGIQLPMQLPIVLSLMTAVRELGLEIPVANLSMPDIIHPVLGTRGLQPTIGLGNVSILQLRCLSAWKQREQQAATTAGPLLRLVGHHCQVYDVMQARAPQQAQDRVRVFIGDEEVTHNDLAYRGRPVSPGRVYNQITAAAALPVLASLLPGAAPLRFSAPAPLGLPGGYPVRIEEQRPALDLPAGLDLAEAVSCNQRFGRRDGIEAIDEQGTVVFTGAARRAVSQLDPGLAEPLDCFRLGARTRRLQELVQAMERG